jgi:O-6-methylguanine DNA methyltransferase
MTTLTTENPHDDTSLALVEAALAELRASAPSSLLPNTLVAAGLADQYTAIDTALGPVFVAWNGRGVSTITEAGDEPAFETRFGKEFGRPLRRVSSLPAALGRAISARLGGDRKARVPVDWRGRTSFEQAVWKKALEIPAGEVRPYSWIAREIGRPRAVRAVGTALARNPIPLVIPCHRVVRVDGHIGQYGLGGPRNKRTILMAEGVDVDGLERMAGAGLRYTGSDTTRIFCLPTCRNARRVTAAHRVQFHSQGEAQSAGYRACKVCRPTIAA